MFKKLLFLLLLLSDGVLAQTHALVIGINNGNLIGAKNDALAMAHLLRQKGISVTKELHDTQATKANILNAFNNIVTQAKPNDWVYLFFSGHGTSPYDPANRDRSQLKKRLEGTGALVSADNQLIIVKESLAPLFRALDQRGVHTVVIVDACFSGMAYKDALNTHANYALFTTHPTRKVAFPYRHLIFLSSTTYSDYASESSRDKRGYFSMAITHCLASNHTREGIEGCLNTIKYQYHKLPQQPVILPTHTFSVFPSFAKNIVVRPTHFTLKEQLLNMANGAEDFDLYTLNQEGLPSKNYHQGEKLSVHLNSKKSGYFVLLMMGSSNQLKLSYPNAQKTPHISADTNKKILTIEAKEPFGEELFGAFLVNKSSAMALQKLHIQTNGLLEKEADIQEAMRIIRQGQIAGKKLVLKSYKN